MAEPPKSQGPQQAHEYSMQPETSEHGDQPRRARVPRAVVEMAFPVVCEGTLAEQLDWYEQQRTVAHVPARLRLRWVGPEVRRLLSSATQDHVWHAYEQGRRSRVPRAWQRYIVEAACYMLPPKLRSEHASATVRIYVGRHDAGGVFLGTTADIWHHLLPTLRQAGAYQQGAERKPQRLKKPQG